MATAKVTTSVQLVACGNQKVRLQTTRRNKGQCHPQISELLQLSTTIQDAFSVPCKDPEGGGKNEQNWANQPDCQWNMVGASHLSSSPLSCGLKDHIPPYWFTWYCQYHPLLGVLWSSHLAPSLCQTFVLNNFMEQ